MKTKRKQLKDFCNFVLPGDLNIVKGGGGATTSIPDIPNIPFDEQQEHSTISDHVIIVDIIGG